MGPASSAVRDDRIFEIKSTYILQPGPASLTDGVRQLHAILARLIGGQREKERSRDDSRGNDAGRLRLVEQQLAPRAGLPRRDRPSTRSRTGRCAGTSRPRSSPARARARTAGSPSRWANAYSTLRRSTRFTACFTSSGSDRLTTMPPSGIGAPVSRFPELAEVDDLLQPLRFVGEAVLVDDEAGVELARRAAPARSPKTAAPSCRARRETPGRAGSSRSCILPGIAILSPPGRDFCLARSAASKSAAVRSSARARCRRRAARSRAVQYAYA